MTVRDGIEIDMREGLSRYPFRLRTGDILSFDYYPNKTNSGIMNKKDLLSHFNINPLLIISGKDKDGYLQGSNIRLLTTTYPFINNKDEKESARANKSALSYLTIKCIDYFFIFENEEMKKDEDRRKLDYVPGKVATIFPPYAKILKEQIWRRYNPKNMRNIKNLRDEVNNMKNADKETAINIMAMWTSISAKTRNNEIAGPSL